MHSLPIIQALNELADPTSQHEPTDAERIIDEYGQDAYEAAEDYLGDEPTYDWFEDAFSGTAESEADYAEQLADDCGLLPEGTQAWPLSCIDWERAGRELFRFDYYLSPITDGSGNRFIFNRNV